MCQSENRKVTRVVSFSGLDGCGKTTLIQAVRQEIDARGLPSSYVWLRYNHYFTRILHAFCRVAGYTRYENYNGTRIGYHDFHRSELISWMAIVLNLVDTFLATLIYVYLPLLLSQRVVFCDRWVFDILVDLAVDTHKELTPLPRWGKAFLWLIPQSAKCFLIQRNIEALEEARPDNKFDRNFQRRWQLYDMLSKDHRIIKISNKNTVKQSINEIFNNLLLPFSYR